MQVFSPKIYQFFLTPYTIKVVGANRSCFEMHFTLGNENERRFLVPIGDKYTVHSPDPGLLSSAAS